jgi:hypothetical protein
MSSAPRHESDDTAPPGWGLQSHQGEFTKLSRPIGAGGESFLPTGIATNHTHWETLTTRSPELRLLRGGQRILRPLSCHHKL